MANFRFFYSDKDTNGRTIFFCGLPIYRRISRNNEKIFYLLGSQISKIKKINEYQYIIAGIPVYRKKIKNKDIVIKGSLLNGITEVENFTSRYMLLTKGLPSKSIDTIFTIVQRVTQFGKNEVSLDMMTNEEKLMLESIKIFKNSIIRINDIYCYKNYFLPINHFEPSVFFYNHGIDFIHNISKLKNKAILDIGGFIGDSLIVFSKLTNNKIYSFEAITKNYDYMIKTIELNNIKNAVPVHTAVGEEQGTIQIRYNGSASSQNENMVKNPEFVETCNVIKIDDYVKENNIDVGLIKVDIEGAEQVFLRGALDTIKKYRPILLISIYHNISDFLDIKPFIENLNLGYTFDVYKPIDGSISGETLLICQVIDD